MKTTFTKEDSTLTVAIEGNIDTVTAPELEKELQDNIKGIENLILDFTKVDYLSSAGLRLLAVFADTMDNAGGSFKVVNPCDDVKEVFEMTGFDTLIDIE